MEEIHEILIALMKLISRVTGSTGSAMSSLQKIRAMNQDANLHLTARAELCVEKTENKDSQGLRRHSAQ